MPWIAPPRLLLYAWGMKAAFIHEPGPAESIVIGDLPDPRPGERDIVVEVKASSVNPIDIYIRSGMIPMDLPLPFIPGCDFAGIVRAVGPGVQSFAPGDKVWGSNQGLLGRQGTMARLACVHEHFAYPIPEGVSFEQAAAASLVGITASIGLHQKACLSSGEKVLVSGGGGAIGSMVIQMAAAEKAKVTATTSSAEKMDRCRNDGATTILDYTKDEWADQALEKNPGGFDVIWETSRTPDLSTLVGLLAENGRMVIMAGRDARPEFPIGPFYVKGCSLFGFAMFKIPPQRQAEAASKVNEGLASGAIRPGIAATFPLDKASEAHTLQESITLHRSSSGGIASGKILVIP